MAERTNQTPESSAPTDAEAARLLSRRQFTRAGLATPIVLSTLASKPVLASSARNCTISGQVSGNLSSPGDADCATLGFTPAYWLGALDWPGDFIRGGLPDHECNFTESTGGPAGTLFEGAFGAAAFAYKATASGSEQACSFIEIAYPNGYPPGSSGATLLQVLNAGSELGREAVASLLNAHASELRAYPLSPTQVIKIFNQVWSTGYFHVNDSVLPWDEDRVIRYLRSINGSNGSFG